MSKTKIVNFDVDWLNIKNLCRGTVNMKDSEVNPSIEWKRKILICRHSPLRSGSVQWKWESIPSYVMGHYVRHVHAIPFVTTSREDRTGVPREQRKQTDMVSMQMIANIEELQNIAEKRICYQADKTTREYMMDLKEEIKKYDEDIAWSLVPSCIRCGGCPESFSNCNFYENFSNNLSRKQLLDLKERYSAYDKYLKGELVNNNELTELYQELTKEVVGGMETHDSRENAKKIIERVKK